MHVHPSGRSFDPCSSGDAIENLLIDDGAPWGPVRLSRDSG